MGHHEEHEGRGFAAPLGPELVAEGLRPLKGKQVPPASFQIFMLSMSFMVKK
jgi:hypothetical protein